MGTTAEKLTYLNDTKQLLKENINSLGGNLTTEPFRQYASVLEGIYERIPKVSGIGSSLSLSPTMTGKIKLNEIQGETLQNGTPTPSSPVPVENVTGLQNVSITGKNLINTVEYNRGTNSSGVISNNTQYLGISDYVKVQPNTTYSVIFEDDIDGTNLYVSSKDKNGNFIDRVAKGTTRTFTTGANTYYVFFYLNKSGVIFETIGGYVQLELGNQPTTYESYKGNTYKVNLGNIELNKIGDYKDRIYKDNGKWYIEKQIGKVVLDGSETYETTGTNTSGKYRTRYVGVVDLIKRPASAATTADIISNQFIPLSANYTYRCYQGISVETNGKISFYDETITQSTSTFTTWLASNNMTIKYVLETPEITEITNNELIEDLETLYTAKSQDGTTNISITSEDLEMILNVSVLKGDVE